MKPENSPNETHNSETSNKNSLSQKTTPDIKAATTRVEEPQTSYNATDNSTANQPAHRQTSLSSAQQQFILRFCNQLVSVIRACDQSESAEIEVGRRLIGKQSVKVRLRAERET